MAKKDELPKGRIYPKGLGGLEDEFPNGPPTAVIEHYGLRLVLRFGKGDVWGDGPVREIRLQPDTLPLEQAAPRVLRNAALYFKLARDNMRLFGPEGTPQERIERAQHALELFHDAAGPGRGLAPPFYSLLAEQYKALVDSGEPHPVKAIAGMHGVEIATSSKWLKETERRGLIERPKRGRKEADDAS
jgi:hypothetical protein